MDDKTMELIKNNLKDPSVYNAIAKASARRSRVTAIVIGSFLIISLIAVISAFDQVNKAKSSVAEYQSQIDACVREAQKQQALAMEAQLIAEEANKVVQEQLTECQKQRK